MEFKSTDTALKVVYVKLNYEKADEMTMQCMSELMGINRKGGNFFLSNK